MTDKIVTVENIQYPIDFEKSCGVHIRDEEVNRYVRDTVKRMHEEIESGKDPCYYYISTGDMHIMVFDTEYGYEVQVYRDPEYTWIFKEDLK